jgi:hypothetical protein
LREDADKLRSPALSMDKAPPPPSLIGRKVAVLVGDGADAKEVQSALAAFAEAGLVAETIGPHGGTVKTSGKPMKVNRAAPNAPSVVYDAIFIPAGVGAALAAQPRGSASSMKPIVTASRSPSRPTPRRFSMQPASRRRPRASGSARGQGW